MQRLVPVSKNVQSIILNSTKVSARLNYSKGTFQMPAQLSTLCQNRLLIVSNDCISKLKTTKNPSIQVSGNSNWQITSPAMGRRYYSSGKYPDHIDIRLPALSPTMEQGTIAKWCVAEGDSVAEGDLIAEIETDKATMGLESSEDGFVAKILVEEKTKDIPLRTLLCIMVRDKSQIGAFADYKPSDDTGDSSSSSSSSSASSEASTPPPPAPKKEAPKSKPSTTPPPPPPPQQKKSAPSAQQKSSGGRVFASPLAKKIAAERNIDLSVIYSVYFNLFR
jgi:biotin carboxyl carrier protein